MVDRSEEKVEKVFRGLMALPSLPQAVERLVELSEREATPKEFAAVISADQGLTAKVLKLVNSAFYGLSKPISSLPHAATLLGTKTLKSLVLSVSIMQVFKKGCEGFDLEAFWRHSVAVAVAAQRLCLKLHPGLADDLYAVGLLHDTGTALLAEHLAEEYSLTLRLLQETGRPLCDIEREVFGVSHAEVGYKLVMRWQLPQRICECIRYHEFGGEKIEDSVADPQTRQALDVLRLAEHFVAKQNLGFLDGAGGEQQPEIQPPPWIEHPLDALEATIGSLTSEVGRVALLLGAEVDSGFVRSS